jgi:hypothetical protein
MNEFYLWALRDTNYWNILIHKGGRAMAQAVRIRPFNAKTYVRAQFSPYGNSLNGLLDYMLGINKQPNFLYIMCQLHLKRIPHKSVMMSKFYFYRKASYNGYKLSYWHNIGTELLSHLTYGQLVDIAALAVHM